MTKYYIIQKEDNKAQLCFANTAHEAIQFHNWACGGDEIKARFICMEELAKTAKTDIIRAQAIIGSLEFVEKAMSVATCTDFKLGAMNIPKELQQIKFLKRKIWPRVTVGADDMPRQLKVGKWFIKPALRCKGFEAFVGKVSELSEGEEVFVSERICLKEEWRVFVLDNKVVGMKPVNPIVAVMPDKQVVMSMVEDFKSAPPAYTLDVGVTLDNHTVLIEAHPFISCGLYGFEEHDILLKMWAKAYKWLKAEVGI